MMMRADAACAVLNPAQSRVPKDAKHAQHSDILILPMPKHPSHILELAKRGAEVRLRELVNEAKNLIGLFPHLRDSFDKDELPLKFIMAEGSGAVSYTHLRAHETRHD